MARLAADNEDMCLGRLGHRAAASPRGCPSPGGSRSAEPPQTRAALCQGLYPSSLLLTDGYKWWIVHPPRPAVWGRCGAWSRLALYLLLQGMRLLLQA